MRRRGDEFEVGKDGFAVGWEAVMLREIATVEFDDEAGLPTLTATRVPITLETVGGLGLGPAMQMLCRARLMLPAEVEVVRGRVRTRTGRSTARGARARTST